MLKTDKDALICDLAETYGIFDYHALPAQLVATLAVGLRDSSRIKQRLAGVQTSPELLLTAAAVDRLSLLVWAQTKDAQHGANKPASMLEALLGTADAKNSQWETFDTAEEFEAARDRILRKEG